MSVFLIFLLFFFLSLSLRSQPPGLESRTWARRTSSPPPAPGFPSKLAPRLHPASSPRASFPRARPVPPSSELAPRPRGGSARPRGADAWWPARRRACTRPRGGPRGGGSRPRGGPRGNVLAPLGSSIFELLRARPSSSHPLPRGREAGAHPRSGGASRRLTGVAGPEAEPARTAEVAGARGGGHRVRAEPARSPAAGSGRSPRFFLDSGESLLLPSSSTAASPRSSSRSSHARVRDMQHSSHEDRPRPLFFEGRTAPGSSVNIRSWDVLVPA